ncbi:MAG: hypothetical protein D6744_05825 [Planctomycetota bacterium]|nr:MAG: hypothetical protein D6744_05825 [Planctomycetota bacterium]
MQRRFRTVAAAALLAMCWSLMGSGCFPLIDLGEEADTPPSPTKLLTVAALRPASDRNVPEGAVVEVEWVASNLTDDEAIATILARDRSDLSDIVLAGGVRVAENGAHQTVSWDTSEFAGRRFSIIVRVTGGGRTEEDIADGEVQVNAAPQFDFTDPFEDTTLEQTDPNSTDDPFVTIRWTSVDPDDEAEFDVGVDIDEDHTNDNELVLLSGTLPTQSGFDTFDWIGRDTEDQRVDPGAYIVYARVNDGVNPERFVDAPGRIIVPELDEPNEPNEIVLEITSPEEDAEFLVGDDPLEIAYTIDESDDVLVDIAIDSDDNHNNANEITISSQRLIDSETKSDSFEWDGTDDDGMAVPDGIYKPHLVINRGSGAPQIVDGSALIFRRSNDDQPLIALLEPATDKSPDPGAFVLIKWRDDDPSETAKVRLTLDDDDTPNESVETDDAEIEILAFSKARLASEDGVQDTFQYKVPATLADGDYFIFAYIDRDEAAPFDHVAVAGGRIRIDTGASP